jgi:hypothetical protein
MRRTINSYLTEVMTTMNVHDVNTISYTIFGIK